MSINDQIQTSLGKPEISGLENFSPPRAIRLLAVVALLLTLGVSYALLYSYGSTVPQYSLVFVLLVSINGLLFIYLTTLYFLATKLYRDTFYFLLGIAWLALAIQVFFQQFFLSPQDRTLRYYIGINLLQFVPTVIFYIAALSSLNSPLNLFRTIIKIAAWMFQIIFTIIIGYWLISDNLSDPFSSRLIFVYAQTPFSAWALMRVGTAIKKRIGLSFPPKLANILAASFYIYGLLQLMYFLEYLAIHNTISSFTASLLIKVVNGVALLKIMLVEFDSLQAQLIQRSVFEDIGALTATLEHDIRNPLGVINAEIVQMKKRFQSDPEVLARIKRMDKETGRIFASTQLVSMLRGDADFYQRSMQKASVGDVIRRSVKVVKLEMDTQNISIMIYESKVMYTRANIPMLEQALVNILKNAVEAIRAAGRAKGKIGIELKSDRKSPQLILINISDNGCGIAEENAPKLTSIFTTKKNREPNSGIGLFSAARIIKIHRGRLEFSSRVGEGTVVSIFLPKWNLQEEE